MGKERSTQTGRESIPETGDLGFQSHFQKGEVGEGKKTSACAFAGERDAGVKVLNDEK